MWKPELDFAEMRLATVRGWHRRFCLWQWRYRGTRERPGLMLALDRGGACRGILYRIDGPGLRGEAGWGVAARDDRRRLPPALGHGDHGRGARPGDHLRRQPRGRALCWARSPGQEIARFIAGACGHVGPSAEYLLETVTRCEELGIHDPGLWRLQELVARQLREAAGRASMTRSSERRMALTPELVARVAREVADAGPEPDEVPFGDADYAETARRLAEQAAGEMWLFAYGLAAVDIPLARYWKAAPAWRSGGTARSG